MILLTAPRGIGRKEVAVGGSLRDFLAAIQEIQGFTSHTVNDEQISGKVKE